MEDEIIVVGCPKTRLTREKFEEVIIEYEKLPKGKWLFNLGNGNFMWEREHISNGFKIINKVENIKNCSNKKRMFEILTHNNVPCLEYFDLDNPTDIFYAKHAIAIGKILCLRRRKRLKRVDNLNSFNYHRDWYRYATTKENKRFEYRVVMLYNEPIVVFIKNPNDHIFKYKQEYCTFARITLPKDDSVLKVCKQATKALGIDMCGVDILVNKKGEAKIIEVNSGNGMAGRTIKKIMKLLRKNAKA